MDPFQFLIIKLLFVSLFALAPFLIVASYLNKRYPNRIYGFFFFWGIAIAPLFSLGVRYALMADPAVPSDDAFYYYTAVVLAPVAEELAKLMGIAAILAFVNSRVNLVAAAVLVGYGFGSIENVITLVSYPGTDVLHFVEISIIRMLITAPGHAVLVLISAAGLKMKYGMVLTVPMAIIVHSVYNHLTLSDGGASAYWTVFPAAAILATILWIAVYKTSDDGVYLDTRPYTVESE